MSGATILLVHGDDSFGVDGEVRRFAAAAGAMETTEIVPAASPDEAAIDRVRLEAAAVGLFGAHLAVLRQPLRAAGRSTAAAERLMALVGELPEGAALALAEDRPSRDYAKAPALLGRLASAVRERGGQVEERAAPRRGELRGWVVRHAKEIGVEVDPKAAALVAERIGGAVWESDIERGEQTRVADSELRKLATYAQDRPITADDVQELTADARPSSVFAVTNALDRREPAAAAEALRRALAEGQPVLRLTASLAGRVADLIVAREMVANRAAPQEMAKRLGRGNMRTAQRLAEASGRYRGEELEAMLTGLFEVDLAIKSNDVEPESAVAAWLGEHLLATRRAPRG